MNNDPRKLFDLVNTPDLGDDPYETMHDLVSQAEAREGQRQHHARLQGIVGLVVAVVGGLVGWLFVAPPIEGLVLGALCGFAAGAVITGAALAPKLGI